MMLLNNFSLGWLKVDYMQEIYYIILYYYNSKNYRKNYEILDFRMFSEKKTELHATALLRTSLKF